MQKSSDTAIRYTIVPAMTATLATIHSAGVTTAQGAVQASLDLTMKSGVLLGAWASNVDSARISAWCQPSTLVITRLRGAIT